MSKIADSFKRLRGDAALGDMSRELSTRIARLEGLMEKQNELIRRLEIRGPAALDPAPTPALPRLVEDTESWKNEAQPGELAFHKRPNDRSGANWEKLNRDVWLRYDFPPTGFEGKTIIDVGAGSRLRTLYFHEARIVAVEPLADKFLAEVKWNDLDKAESVYALPAEVEIPELIGRGDLVVSVNALDHGFNFEDAIRNIRHYLKDDGIAFLSFDQHHVPDQMHPLVLTDPIVREVYDRCGLRIDRFEEKFRYHGGPGPKALNYWLSPIA